MGRSEGLGRVGFISNWYFVHRLVAFNCVPGLHHGNADRHPCDHRYEVHHHASGLLYPWRDSTRRNMKVLSVADHRRWHNNHRGVHHCLPGTP